MNDLKTELLAVLFAASDDKARLALQILRGEVEVKEKASKPLLMSMGDAAKYLGVGRATLWRMIKAGKISKVEILPNSYRVPKEDLENLVQHR